MHELARWWGRKALITGESNPFHPEDPAHRQFVEGRMQARELARAQEKINVQIPSV